MTDKELLELAAKAAGIDLQPGYHSGRGVFPVDVRTFGGVWNPLTDDGDALRLAVKLGIAVTPYPIYEFPKHSVVASQKNMEHSRYEVVELYGDDQMTATCRAIVRAAAEIGKEKP